MKMYILAFATLIAAAGSASANNDYIDCYMFGRKSHSTEYQSKYCGDSSRYESQTDRYNNGSDSSYDNNSKD